MPPARVVYSCLFFVLTMALIAVARPSSVFDASGRPRPFGVGEGRTVFPLGVVVVIVSVLSLYAFALIDLVYT
jgi:hypothetical protein